jgi:hypothetical protein
MKDPERMQSWLIDHGADVDTARKGMEKLMEEKE